MYMYVQVDLMCVEGVDRQCNNVVFPLLYMCGDAIHKYIYIHTYVYVRTYKCQFIVQLK